MRIVVLDLIRFFAALSVVLYHYISRPESNIYPLFSEATKYGYLGVPLFFIISGYVIALSAENRTAIQFGISRFVRLYPALWVGATFTVIIVIVFTDKQYSLLQLLANFTLLNDYLGFEDIDGIYWTLKQELKFYACIFLVLLFGFFKKFKIWLSLWLVFTIIYAVSEQPFFMGWFISPYYSSFFIAGVAFFLIQRNGRDIFNHLVLTVSIVLSGFRAFEQAEGFIPDPSAIEKLISVSIVSLFYIIMYFLSIGKMNLKPRSILVTLGALTYPLYLIHNVAGKVIINYFSNVIPEETLVIFVIILMLLISWLIHITIEKPFATPMKNYLLAIFSRKQVLKNQYSRPPSSAAD